jgi:predicted MFS family arabinose efflux permease
MVEMKGATSAVRVSSASPGTRSPTASLAALASVDVMFLATTAAPTPLYALYSSQWHLSAADITLVFGVYALFMLAALLALGRISDHVGRRPVMLAAIAVQVVAMAVFATAGGLPALLVGRVLQGLSTGAGIAAVGAGLVEVDASKGTMLNAAAPPFGSAVGVLASAVLVAFAPAPAHVVYVVFAVLFVGQAAMVLRLAETSPRVPGAWTSVRPAIKVPSAVRRKLLAAAPVLFSVWALSGLFGSLGPDLVHQVSGSSSPIYGAAPLAILSAMSPVTAYVTRSLPPRRLLGIGITALAAGVIAAVAAIVAGSAGALIASSVIAGAGFGAGFRGGIGLVLPAAADDERAGTLSVLYIISYLGFGVPVIVAGVAVVQTGSLTGTALGYAGVLLAIALFAAAALRRSSAADTAAQPGPVAVPAGSCRS